MSSPLHLTIAFLRLRSLTLKASFVSLEHNFEERSPLWFRAPHFVRGTCPLVYCAFDSYSVPFRVWSRRHDLLPGCFCGHCAVRFSPDVASGCIPCLSKPLTSALLLRLLVCSMSEVVALENLALVWRLSGTATMHHLEQHSSLVPCARQTCSVTLPSVHLSGVVY